MMKQGSPSDFRGIDPDQRAPLRFDDLCFDGKTIAQQDCRFAHFIRCSFKKADVNHSRFDHARFTDCYFSGARLCGTDLTGCQIDGFDVVK